MSDEFRTATVDLTADIVSAFVSNNTVSMQDIPSLISSVYTALSNSGSGAALPVEIELVPAVSVKKSVTPDFIICLEDGKKFKSLKRHLSSKYGLSPDQYRAKWSLPYDYPMVAPNYAASRSALAHQMGLGRKASSPQRSASKTTSNATPGRGRRKAA